MFSVDDPKITVKVGETEINVAGSEQSQVDTDPNPFVDASEDVALEGVRTRYRDILKWMVTAFAGVGTLLVAGLSVGGLRDVNGTDFWVAVAGIGLVGVGVILVVGMAARGMAPTVVTFKQIANANADTQGIVSALAKDFQNSSLLDKYPTFAEFYKAFDDNDDHAQNLGVGRIRPWVKFYCAKHRFEQAITAIIAGVILITVGTVIFASHVGASPTKSDAAVPAAPDPTGSAVYVRVAFTRDGRTEFGDRFPAACLGSGLRGLVTSGSEKDGYDLVTLGHDACEAMHLFVRPSAAHVSRSCPIPVPFATTTTAALSAFRVETTPTTATTPTTRAKTPDVCVG
jgi:hypothetical protein